MNFVRHDDFDKREVKDAYEAGRRDGIEIGVRTGVEIGAQLGYRMGRLDALMERNLALPRFELSSNGLLSAPDDIFRSYEQPSIHVDVGVINVNITNINVSASRIDEIHCEQPQLNKIHPRVKKRTWG